MECIGGTRRTFIHVLFSLMFSRTWVLTTEDVVEPPRRLAEECKKVGIEDGAFVVCDIGETLWF